MFTYELYTLHTCFNIPSRKMGILTFQFVYTKKEKEVRNVHLDADVNFVHIFKMLCNFVSMQKNNKNDVCIILHNLF